MGVTSEPVAEDSAPVEAEATETVTSEPVVEESAPVEAEVTETEATESVTEEEDAVEPVVEEEKVEVPEEEEDGPIEDWTKKELADECKTMGISDKGNKAVLIERIKEALATKKAENVESTPVTEAEPEAVEEEAVEVSSIDNS